MQLVLFKEDFPSPALQLTMETICRHGGFFYSWQETAGSAEKPGLALRYRSPDRIQPGSLQLPALCPAEQMKQAQTAIDTFDVNGQSVKILKGSSCKAGDNLFPLDLVANVFYHLNRIEEQPFSHPDAVDPEGGYSMLQTNGNFLTPVVDLLVDYFAEWLRQQAALRRMPLLRKSAWPGGEPFALAMTHDVDFIRAFHPLKKMFFKIRALIGFGPFASAGAIEKIDRAHWGFDRLLPYYKEKNWPVTFLFIARHREGWHRRYEIRRKKMRRVIGQIVNAGHEIALHCSRFAFDHPARYKLEKMRLQRVSRFKLRGMRHHYLRGLFPQIWEQAAKLGLSYDTSMCHRRKSGFRAGTARPYPVQTTRGTILEIPTIFFENTLPGEGREVEASLNEIEALLATVKWVGGCMTILWHSNNLSWPQHYQRLWKELTNRLESEQAWRERLDRITDWIIRRDQLQLTEFQSEQKRSLIKLRLAPQTTKFCLYLPEGHACQDIKPQSVRWQCEKELLKIDNPQGETEMEIEVQKL